MKRDLLEERSISSLVDARRYLKHSHLPLALYGAGGTAGKLRESCFNYASIAIDAICDSDPAKHGQMFYNLVILSPEELVEKYPDANILITIVDKYIKEVYARLLTLGVRKDRIFKWTQAYDYSPFPLKEFSVCPWRDLFRFKDRLGDDASRDLFRLRYRHWLLGDRGENPSCLPAPTGQRVVRYADASDLCCDIDWQGEELAHRDILLEFDNGDLLAARALFALAALRPEGVFFLREGSARKTTRLWSLDRESAHVAG